MIVRMSSPTGTPFTAADEELVLGSLVRSTLGPEAADDVVARFAEQEADADGVKWVDLGDRRDGVVQALKRVETDGFEPTTQALAAEVLRKLTA
jgi:hypothetical protein